jgi:hypothetical protein
LCSHGRGIPCFQGQGSGDEEVVDAESQALLNQADRLVTQSWTTLLQFMLPGAQNMCLREEPQLSVFSSHTRLHFGLGNAALSTANFLPLSSLSDEIDEDEDEAEDGGGFNDGQGGWRSRKGANSK